MDSIAYRAGDTVCRMLTIGSCSDGAFVHAIGYAVIVGVPIAFILFFFQRGSE
jgi:hypothetical protein